MEQFCHIDGRVCPAQFIFETAYNRAPLEQTKKRISEIGTIICNVARYGFCTDEYSQGHCANSELPAMQRAFEALRVEEGLEESLPERLTIPSVFKM